MWLPLCHMVYISFTGNVSMLSAGPNLKTEISNMVVREMDLQSMAHSGYYCQNKCVFSFFQNTDSDEADVMSSGRLFQSLSFTTKCILVMDSDLKALSDIDIVHTCAFPSVLGHCCLGERKGNRPTLLCW